MLSRSRLIAIFAAATSVLAIAGPAHATVSISCADMKFDSSIDIVLGAGPVPNVFSVSMSVGGRDFTTAPGQPGERENIECIQMGFGDLVAPQVTRRVAAIRLLRADHDTMPLQIGILQIEEDPPVGISCEGP